MNPIDERRLLDAMRAVREEASGKAIPASLETNLRSAFRARRRPSTAHRRWAGMAIAAALAGSAAWLSASRPPEIDRPAPQTKAPAAPQAAFARPNRANATPQRRPLAARAQRAAPPRLEPVAATEFVAVPYAPPFEPYDRGQLMRVRIPRQSLRSLGFPVGPGTWVERVDADILMGEDGIARAVRFVKK